MQMCVGDDAMLNGSQQCHGSHRTAASIMPEVRITSHLYMSNMDV